MIDSANELAILRSVCYASLFDYPLTLPQLRRTLIESTQTERDILATYEGSDDLQRAISYRDSFFFLRGREHLIAERQRREAASHAFLRRHRAVLALICALPAVRMVALSGSIAHLNLDRGGDLDLFIVTRGPRVWSVTVGVVLLAKLLRRRDVICANYVMSDAQLAFEPPDLFTASQLLHLKPLVGAEMHRELLAANPFVWRFYPNARETNEAPAPTRIFRIVRRLDPLLRVPMAMLEAVCRASYGWYLRRQSGSWPSPEQVRLERDCLKLHTRSHRQAVLERLDEAVERLRADRQQQWYVDCRS